MYKENNSINNLDGKKDASVEIESDILKTVVDQLCNRNDNTSIFIQKKEQYHSLPSRDVIEVVIEELRSVLFPGFYGNSELTLNSMQFYIGATLDKVFLTLKDQIKRGLCFECDDHPVIDRCLECDERALSITKSFISKLPSIQQLLSNDVKAHYEGDPAAKSPYETIFCYPGVLAITNYRIAHELFMLGVPLIPRIITEYAHNTTGIDIHPGASIGESFFIDHGTGVVIGETSIIGDNVRIYQGVTLGAKSFSLDDEGKPIKGIERHPIVEDDVVIYSGATILGRVIIGKGSIIGGNVWLTHSVPSGSHITQIEAREEAFHNGAGI
ncbi:MAG: serine O-acetyltransferase EpsC [Candidatus Heimdallarchaeota archaeon]